MNVTFFSYLFIHIYCIWRPDCLYLLLHVSIFKGYKTELERRPCQTLCNSVHLYTEHVKLKWNSSSHPITIPPTDWKNKPVHTVPKITVKLEWNSFSAWPFHGHTSCMKSVCMKWKNRGLGEIIQHFLPNI